MYFEKKIYGIEEITYFELFLSKLASDHFLDVFLYFLRVDKF